MGHDHHPDRSGARTRWSCGSSHAPSRGRMPLVRDLGGQLVQAATGQSTTAAPRSSRLSTVLMEALLHETRRAPGGSSRRALSALRRARLLAGDPVVTCTVAARELLLPLSHDLPVHLARHPAYSSNLGRVAQAL